MKLIPTETYTSPHQVRVEGQPVGAQRTQSDIGGEMRNIICSAGAVINATLWDKTLPTATQLVQEYSVASISHAVQV